MIVCPNCGNENQDHYKFCLGCGSDLPRVEQKAKPLPTPTPPTGIPAISDSAFSAAEAEAGEAPTSVPAPEPATAMESAAAFEPEPEEEPVPLEPKVSREPPREYAPEPAPTSPAARQASGSADDGVTICSGCGTVIQPGFAFCGACGAPVGGAAPSFGAGAAVAAGARLVLIQPDGTEGGHVDVPRSEVAVGRDAGGFFASDPFLSPTHAIFCATGDEVIIKDAGSLNGVFVKIVPDSPVEIRSGDIFRMGQELILFEEIDRGNTASDGTEKMGSPIEGLWGRVALIVGRGRVGNAFPVGGDGVVFGRERGNILFPDDGYVSGLHLRLYTENNRFYLNDLGSSNGTFVRITEETRVKAGAFLLMGQQLFRVDIT